MLYLDGVHFSIRHGGKADATIILTALGVDLEGNKEVLALHACAEESKEGWLVLLQDLRTRGATQIDLIVDFRTRWLVGCAHRTLLSHPSPTLSRA